MEHVGAPTGQPALLDLGGEIGRIHDREAAAQQGSEHAMDQPARTAVDQRQRGRHDRMVGRAEPDLLRQREPQHHPRLGVVGQVEPGGGVDQHVEVGQAAQRFTDDRRRQRGVGRRQVARGMGGVVHRQSAAKHRIEHGQRGAAGGNTVGGVRFGQWGRCGGWHGALYASSARI